MNNIFRNLDKVGTASYHYQVERFENEVLEIDLAELKYSEARLYSFDLTGDQKKTVTNYMSVYDDSPTGISRILSKVYMRRLFRQASQRQQ